MVCFKFFRTFPNSSSFVVLLQNFSIWLGQPIPQPIGKRLSFGNWIQYQIRVKTKKIDKQRRIKKIRIRKSIQIKKNQEQPQNKQKNDKQRNQFERFLYQNQKQRQCHPEF